VAPTAQAPRRALDSLDPCAGIPTDLRQPRAEHDPDAPDQVAEHRDPDVACQVGPSGVSGAGDQPEEHLAKADDGVVQGRGRKQEANQERHDDPARGTLRCRGYPREHGEPGRGERHPASRQARSPRPAPRPRSLRVFDQPSWTPTGIIPPPTAEGARLRPRARRAPSPGPPEWRPSARGPRPPSARRRLAQTAPWRGR
jgi:hypothetical protein